MPEITLDMSTFKVFLAKAMIKLNRIQNLHLAIFNIEKKYLLGFDMLCVTMHDKDRKIQFEVNIWLDCFNPEMSGQRLNRIDNDAGLNKLEGREKILGRLA